MIAFTVLGVLVWLVACYRAGWWLALALDVLVPIWTLGKVNTALTAALAHHLQEQSRA